MLTRSKRALLNKLRQKRRKRQKLDMSDSRIVDRPESSEESTSESCDNQLGRAGVWDNLPPIGGVDLSSGAWGQTNPNTGDEERTIQESESVGLPRPERETSDRQPIQMSEMERFYLMINASIQQASERGESGK